MMEKELGKERAKGRERAIKKEIFKRDLKKRKREREIEIFRYIYQNVRSY